MSAVEAARASNHKRSLRATLAATVVPDPADLRVAAALGLGACAARAFLPGEPGLPCPLRELTGVPCPLCGTTTSVTAALRLDLGASLAASPGGVAAVAVGVAVLVSRPRIRVPLGLIVVALVALWLYQLHRFALL